MTDQEINAINELRSYPQFWVLRKVAKELKEEMCSSKTLKPSLGDMSGQAWGIVFLEEYIDSFLGKLAVEPPKTLDRTHE